MNLRRVLRILGLVLYVLATAQLVPLAWCLFPTDGAAAAGFLAGSLGSAVLGFVFRHFGDEEGELYRREGVLIVVGSWLLASLTGAVPYVVSGSIPSVVDALFESTSGFTTTGATILIDIEAVSRPVLFWRSMTQWLGGIGIVVLFVALLSELGPGARFLLKLEVPGPKAEILHARVRETAIALFRIYLVLTVAQVLLMLAFGAGLYDAIVASFSTIATGGFSPHSESIGFFSPAIQVIVLVFMLVSGINFSLHYALVGRRDTTVLKDVELRIYVGVVTACAAIIAFDVWAGEGAAGGVGRCVLDASFQVVSIMTTSGFSTADFAEWPTLSRVILVTLMFGGACAGSTSGGAKLVRLLVGWKVAMREVRLTFSPNSVVPVSTAGRRLPEESLRSVVALLFLWVLACGVGAVALSAGGTDFVTATTASLAMVSNIGPGLGDVGPNGNFAFFASWQKLLMLLLMLLGRLEFFALLALLQCRFWQR